MIERFLPIISDPEDYVTAVSIFNMNRMLTNEESAKLLDIYYRYVTDDNNDQQFCKVCLAIDILPREEYREAEFQFIGLTGKDSNGLLEIVNMLTGTNPADTCTAKRATAIVSDIDIMLPIRILVARSALDVLTGSSELGAMKTEISDIAEFLIGCDTKLLDRYTPLIQEVRIKCAR